MSITQWAPVGRRGASDMPLTTSVNHWLTSMTNASPCPFSVDIATTAVFTPENSQPNLFVFDPMTRRMKLIPAAQVTTNLLESHFGTQGGGAAVMHNDLMTPSFDEFAGGAVWAQIAAEAGLRRPSETAADAANKYAHFATFGQGAGGIAINRNIAAAKPPQPPSRHTGRTFDSATAESPAIIFQGPGGQPSAGNNASTKSDGKSEGDCDTPPALSAVPVAHSADTHAISMGTPLPPARFVSVPSAIFFSERPDPSTMPVTMLITAEILSSDDVSVLIRRRFPTPQGVLVSLRSEQSLAMDRYTPIHGMTSPSIRDFVAYAVVPSTGSYVDPASARCQVEEWTGMGRGGGRGTPGGDRSLTASHLPFPPLKLKNNAIPSPGGGAREPSPYLGTVADATRQPLPIAQGTMIAGLASAAAVTIAEALLRREANIGSNSTCALTVWIRSSSSNTSPTYTVIALPCASINGDSLTAFSWMEFVNTPAKQQQQQPPPPPPAWSTHMAASTSTAPPGSVKPGAKTGPRPVSASTRRSSPGRKPEGDSPAYTAVTNSPPRRFGAHESRELDLLHSTSQYLASSPRERCCPNCHRLLGEQRQPPAAMSVKMANSEAPSRPTSAKSAVTAPAPVPVPSLGYKVVSVRYVAIAEWMLRQQRRVQKGLEKLIPATIPQLPKKRKDGRTVLPPRPRSARHASDPAAVARLPQTAACFQTTHEWAKMPPVLERLNVPLEDILERAVWAQRTVNLCGECAALFDPEAANAPPAASRGTSPPRHSSPSKAAAVASEKTGTEAAKPPPGLTSDVIDCIALTDLQAQHRETRRVQREKFEMRLVALECADHEARPSTPVREASKVEELLESFAGHDAVITTADAPLSWTLCSELYYAMLRVCALPPEPELGAVVSRPARNTQAGRFPQPEVLVATKFQPDSSTSPNRGGGGVPGAEEDDDEAQANAPSLSESLSYRSLARTSHTFAQMRHAERQMVVRFVGGDKNHVAGLVLGTGTHEEDTLA